MATRDETLRLQFEVEGIANLRDLGVQIDKLGAQGTESAAELSKLTDSLADTQALQASLARLRELGQAYIGLQKQITDAQAATVALDAASKASANTAAQGRAAIERQQAGIRELADSTRNLGISEEARQQITRESVAEIARLTAEVKAAETAQRKYDAELASSRDTVSKLAAQQDRLRAPLAQVREELQQAGVSVRSYGAAQAELQSRSAGTEAALRGLAATVSQQVASNRAAAVSVQQLADANETLGRRGFGDIAAEIAKVRAAYETLRNSGTANTRELAQAQARLIERTRDLRAEYGSLGNSLRQVQGSLIAAGASLFTVTRLLSNASRASAEFSKSIAAIGTIAPQADLDALSESVRNLTREFGGDSAKQAAALYEIIAAGVEDTSSALEILATANKLAIGGLADTGIAASGLVATLNAYGLSAENATRVSDAFFVAAAAGNTTIEELSQSIGGVAPLAAAVGVSFESLTAAVGALTAGGLATGQAFTQVQSLLTALVKPTKEASDEAERLGIQFDTAALKSQGLQEFLSGVATAAGGSETSLAKLFGRVEGLQGVLALTGNQADAFAKALTDMESGAGRTEAAFARLADTPAQAAARFQAAVGELQKSFGAAVNAATPLLESLTGLVNLFNELPSGLRTGAAGVVALTAVVAPLAIAIVQSRAALVLLLGSLRALPATLAASAASMGVFTASTTAVAAGAATARAAVGLLSRAFVVLGAAVAGFQIGEGLGQVLNQEFAERFTEGGQRVQAFADELRASGEAGAAAATRLANFSSVAVRSAADIAAFGDAQREAYRTALEGLEQYLQARGRELIALKASGEATQSQIAELAGLRDRLSEVRDSFIDVDRAALGAAESVASISGAGASAAVREITEALGGATANADEFGKSLGKLFKGLEFSGQSQKVGDIAIALAAVGSASAQAADTVRDTLAAELAKLSGDDLLAFQRAAEAAFGSLGGAAFDAANVLDTALQEQLRRLGVNMQAAGVTITDTGRKIIASFQAIAESGRASAGAVGAAFSAALSKATTTAEVDALGETLKRAFDAGKIGAEAYGAAVSAAAVRSREIVAGANEAVGAIDGIGEAGKAAAQALIAAFVASRAALSAEANKIAASIGEALASGKPTEALQGQLTALEGQIKQTTANIDGLKSEISGIGKSSDEAGKVGANGIGRITQSVKGLTNAAKEAGEAVADIGVKSDSISRNSGNLSGPLISLAEAAASASLEIEALGEEAFESFTRSLGLSRGVFGIIQTTGRSTLSVINEIVERSLLTIDAAARFKEELQESEKAAKAAADAVAQIAERAVEAADELRTINEQLQDEADRRAGNEDAIRRRQYEDQLRRIEELAAAGGTAESANAERARQLAKANFDADIADIKAREREQLASDDRVEGSRRSRQPGGAGSGGVSRDAPANAGAQNIVINVNAEQFGTVEDLARRITPELARLNRRGVTGA